MDATGQIFLISKFPDILSFVIILTMFGEIWRKSVKDIYLINSLKVVVCLPKSNTRFIKVGKRLAPKTIKTTGPLSVSDDGWRFSWKSNPLQTRLFYLDRSVERWGGRHNNDQSCQRQRKNLRQKWKNRKICWGARQRFDIQLSKLRFEAIVNVFASRLVLA